MGISVKLNINRKLTAQEKGEMPTKENISDSKVESSIDFAAFHGLPDDFKKLQLLVDFAKQTCPNLIFESMEFFFEFHTEGKVAMKEIAYMLFYKIRNDLHLFDFTKGSLYLSFQGTLIPLLLSGTKDIPEKLKHLGW